MSQQLRAWGSVLLVSAAVGALLVLVAWAGRATSAPAVGQALTRACPASLVQDGHDYHGLTLTMCNFAGQDLTNANFQGATLTAVIFLKANLTGADFSNATIVDSQNPAFPTDFSFSVLMNAKFIGTTFNGTTYFTYATLTCTDFSQTNINNGNAIFGDEPLIYDHTAPCRTKFQGTTLSCEFVNDWNAFDLTGANVSACASEFKGHDFSGTILTNVVFDGVDLTGSRWQGVNLTGASFQGATLDNATGMNGTPTSPSQLSGAKFNNASLKNVDLSNALLYGANFTNANLTNSSLAGSVLTNNPQANPPIVTPAQFTGAHLKNVNLANAKLAGVTFTYASFYSDVSSAPSFPCSTDTAACANPTGYTCNCATASGADLTRTDFSNAFLYGVDFRESTTTINGTKFSSAILAAASFDQANFVTDPSSGGAAVDFSQALLQGTNLTGRTKLANSSLSGAFVDFGAPSNTQQGNIVFVLLPQSYTRFNGWAGATTPCVQMAYPVFTVAPPDAANMTCPDGEQPPGGCGTTLPGACPQSPPVQPFPNPHWASGVPIASNPVPGWYFADATYDCAPVNLGAMCGGSGPSSDPNW